MPVSPIGDPANRIDLIFLGDGYTRSELDKFHADIQKLYDEMFDQEPFREYANYFNVWRLDVPSAQSGSDHPERDPPVLRDTAFDSTFNCADIVRLVCVSYEKVNAAIARIPAARRDFAVVIVNDDQWGGSGGPVAVATTHSSSHNILLHELGHTIGLLADEYTSNPPSCQDNVEPFEANATRQTVRRRIKWNAWIDSSTPVPTESTELGVPGLYLGAKYCENTLYRPTFSSKMRNSSRPFEQINTEQLIRRFYSFVSPLDSFSPTSSRLSVPAGERLVFSVTPMIPATHELEVTWRVDGMTTNNTSTFLLETRSLSTGVHTVTATVADTTPLVRIGPDRILIEHRAWTVDIALAEPVAPEDLTATGGDESVTLSWDAPFDGGSQILRYEYRYRQNDSDFTPWATIPGGTSATSLTVSDLANGTSYTFEVRAVNEIGPGKSATVDIETIAELDFAHFINGTSNGVSGVSDLVLVNVKTSTVSSAIYFYDQMGALIDPAELVDVVGDLDATEDGGIVTNIEGLGETTVSTDGQGDLVTGSVKVFSSGRVGGVLRFDISGVGVAGVGASQALNDAIFPARRMAGGINTGAAIRNLSPEQMEVTCSLMQDGEVLRDPISRTLEVDGQRSWFINQAFPYVDTSDFEGSVRCTVAEGGMFTGVAVEMDERNRIFTTVPMVPVDPEAADDGMSTLNFAHFGNGDIGRTAMSSDLVFVNVANSAVAPAIYFYAQDGFMIAADTLVDAKMEGLEMAEDGALIVMDEIAPFGEMTISTNGMGAGIVGSVKVVSDGPIGGVIRFKIPGVGAAGVGASQAVNSAIFPARRMAGGINTGAAIRNLEAERMMVTCRLMQGGEMLTDKDIDLPANGQRAFFIHQLFQGADTTAFEGSVHCSAPEDGLFTGVALEMDDRNRIFTSLPVVPVQ